MHPPPPHATRSRRALLWRGAGIAGALLALLAVFSLYTQPDFFFTVANQVWACF